MKTYTIDNHTFVIAHIAGVRRSGRYVYIWLPHGFIELAFDNNDEAVMVKNEIINAIHNLEEE